MGTSKYFGFSVHPRGWHDTQRVCVLSTFCQWYCQQQQQDAIQAQHEALGLLLRNISSSLLCMKDNLGMKTPGIYGIPCECREVDIRHIGHSSETRVKEHCNLDKSSIGRHSSNLSYCLKIQNTSILSRTSRRIRPHQQGRDWPPFQQHEIRGGVSLFNSWEPLIPPLNEHRNTSSKDKEWLGFANLVHITYLKLPPFLFLLHTVTFLTPFPT
jgi:hypothetical protein